MRFRLYEVSFNLTCEGHPNYSKTYFVNIMNCFNEHQMWPKIDLIMSESPYVKFLFHYIIFIFLIKIGDFF